MEILYKQKRGDADRPPGGSDAWEAVEGSSPGPLVYDEDEISLHRDLDRDGTTFGGEALPFLWQKCPFQGAGQTPLVGDTSTKSPMFRKCYNMTKSQCRIACLNYGEWQDGAMCCEPGAPRGSTDFFGYPCHEKNPKM